MRWELLNRKYRDHLQINLIFIQDPVENVVSGKRTANQKPGNYTFNPTRNREIVDRLTHQSDSA